MRNILDDVRAIAESCFSWQDFRDQVLGENGIIADYYPDVKERQQFYYSQTYQEINKIGFKVMEKFDVRFA